MEIESHEQGTVLLKKKNKTKNAMFLTYQGQILHRLFWALQVYLDRKLFSCTVNRKKSKQRKFVKKQSFLQAE